MVIDLTYEEIGLIRAGLAAHSIALADPAIQAALPDEASRPRAAPCPSAWARPRPRRRSDMLPTVKGLVLTTDGRAYPTKVATLDDYQAIVGGYIDVVILADGCSMYVNDEGLLDGLPVNAAASALVPGGVIVGNVVIVGPTDDDGDDTDIPDEAAYRYTQLC